MSRDLLQRYRKLFKEDGRRCNLGEDDETLKEKKSDPTTAALGRHWAARRRLRTFPCRRMTRPRQSSIEGHDNSWRLRCYERIDHVEDGLRTQQVAQSQN